MLNRIVLVGFMITMIADWNQDGFPPPFMFTSRAGDSSDWNAHIIRSVLFPRTGSGNTDWFHEH